MVLTVHHLGISQSERIVWLCEELGVDYKLVTHTRSPILAPDSLKSIPGNASGKAPFMEDSDAGVTLSESGAIAEYIIHKYGGGKLAVGSSADAKAYAEYLYWFHFSNATLQPAGSTSMFINGAQVPADNMMKQFADSRLQSALQQMDARLGESKWLAGDELTAADVMVVWSLTSQRYFAPLSLAPHKNILRFLQDVGDRDAYRRAMEKGDPEMALLLGAEAPEKSIMEVGGTASDVWKKK